jgi:geranylgeranyl diphosphate synthase type I
MEYSYEVPDKRLATLIQRDLEQFSEMWRRDDTIGLHEPIDAFCDVMLRGGKRLRGVLAMQSYYAHGGRDESVALGAARVFELIQTSLLVVDDIADHSALRRGGPSAHMRIEAYARKHGLKGDALHYGQVQAMNVAYAGLHKATIELLDLPVDSDVARRASKYFHENIATTINGQIDDVYNEAATGMISEEAVESVLKRKAAHYTILGPIELGAHLAGTISLPLSLRDYSIHTGCAFQIADDIISTFNPASETGKSNNDDIREGKLTLLVQYSLSHGTDSQKKILNALLGRRDTTNEECDVVRDLFKATGGLAHANKRLALHMAKALSALEFDVESDSRFVTYLKTLTEYVANRQA